MRTNGVVESLDVGKHGIGSLVVGEEMSKVKALALETAKEVFGDSVITRITFAAHTLNKAGSQEGGAKTVGSVLDAAIGVKDESSRGASGGESPCPERPGSGSCQYV